MSGFTDRENSRERKNVVSSMIEATEESEKVTLKGRPKADRETKQRIGLVILPSLYEAIKQIAYVERRSVSEIVAECLEQYVFDNAQNLKQYKRLMKKQ